MALADQMRCLTQRLGEDHDNRTAAVVGIRTTVAREMDAFRTDRQAVAEAQSQQLRAYMADLDSQVASLLADLSTARVNLSREQQRKLAEDIGALRQSTSALLDECNTMRLAVAQRQQGQLSANMDALRKDATALRDRLEVAYQAMADEQRLALGRYMSELLNDVDQAMAALHAARQSMANDQRQKLAKEDKSLKDEVVLFRTQIGADQAEARQVWSRYSKLMQQRGTRKFHAILQAPASPAQEKKAESPRRIVEPVAPEPPTHVAEPAVPEPGAMDDFRAIQGIGASMERRLHKAGVSRFAQLAAMTPEELRRAAALGPFAEVESWIERARELAEQK